MIDDALRWLKQKAEEKGHVELTDITMDGLDIEIRCPFCNLGFWYRLTAKERQAYVVAVPHVCSSRPDHKVIFHVKRERSTDELMDLYNRRFAEDGEKIVSVPVRAQAVKTRKPDA